MKNVAVLLAPGFEEAEAIVTIDILRRLNINVQTISCVDILPLCFSTDFIETKK